MKKPSLTPLEPAEIEAALAHLQGWSGDQHGLKKTIKFRSFRAAMQFMQACVEGIDQRDHHPVWCNKYDSLDIHLDTFDAGHRVTAKDIDLAQFLDSVLRDTNLAVI